MVCNHELMLVGKGQQDVSEAAYVSDNSIEEAMFYFESLGPQCSHRAK